MTDTRGPLGDIAESKLPTFKETINSLPKI
jgi:hypothetical protein